MTFEQKTKNLLWDLINQGRLNEQQKKMAEDILDSHSDEVSTKTPLGEIKAYKGTDPNYPGVFVDFIPTDGYSRPAGVVECDLNEDNPVGGIRVVVYGHVGNCGEDVGPTSISRIYSKNDLPLAGSRLTEDAKDVVRAIGGDYEIIGGIEGLALIRNTKNGECYRVDVQRIPDEDE